MRRVDLTEIEHHDERAWATGEPGHWMHAEIRLGQLTTGQWFAARSGRRWAGAWTGRDEREVCEAVEAWMRRGGDWREISPVDN
jgi:hypothetical protein